MKLPDRIIRPVVAALAATAACLFAVYYSGLNACRLEADVYGSYSVTDRIGDMVPGITRLYHTAGWWSLWMPSAILLVGLACACLGERRSWTVTIVDSIGWLFSLAWPLGCIVAWEMPRQMLVPVIVS